MDRIQDKNRRVFDGVFIFLNFFRREEKKGVDGIVNSSEIKNNNSDTAKSEKLRRIKKMETTIKTHEDWIAEGDSRETSQELMEAIWDVAGKSYDEAVRIWETGDHLSNVWEIVTKNGLIPDAEFCWGASGCNWALDLNYDRITAKMKKYQPNQFQLYCDETGWESWMDAHCTNEEPTESELKKIEAIQRKLWETAHAEAFAS